MSRRITAVSLTITKHHGTIRTMYDAQDARLRPTASRKPWQLPSSPLVSSSGHGYLTSDVSFDDSRTPRDQLGSSETRLRKYWMPRERRRRGARARQQIITAIPTVTHFTFCKLVNYAPQSPRLMSPGSPRPSIPVDFHLDARSCAH